MLLLTKLQNWVVLMVITICAKIHHSWINNKKFMIEKGEGGGGGAVAVEARGEGVRSGGDLQLVLH